VPRVRERCRVRRNVDRGLAPGTKIGTPTSTCVGSSMALTRVPRRSECRRRVRSAIASGPGTMCMTPSSCSLVSSWVVIAAAERAGVGTGIGTGIGTGTDGRSGAPAVGTPGPPRRPPRCRRRCPAPGGGAQLAATRRSGENRNPRERIGESLGLAHETIANPWGRSGAVIHPDKPKPQRTISELNLSRTKTDSAPWRFCLSSCPSCWK
jgi:hypothetical protein